MGKGKRLPNGEVLLKMCGFIVFLTTSSLGPGWAFSLSHGKQNFLAPSPLPLDDSYFTVSFLLPMDAAGWEILTCNSSVEVSSRILVTTEEAGRWVATDPFLGFPCQCSTSTVSRSGLLVSRHFQYLWLTGLVWGFGVSLVPRGALGPVQGRLVCIFQNQKRCPKDRKFCFPWQQSNCPDVTEAAACAPRLSSRSPRLHLDCPLPGLPPLEPGTQTQRPRSAAQHTGTERGAPLLAALWLWTNPFASLRNSSRAATSFKGTMMLFI